MKMQKYKEILRKNNLKITPKRIGIINYFVKDSKYATPYEVWLYLKKKFRNVGFPTVYRNLNEFERIGILVKVQGGEDRFFYGICKVAKNIHHHHIICTKCHKIIDIELCNFDEIKYRVEEITGFEIKEHHLFIKGLCERCKKEGKGEKN